MLSSLAPVCCVFLCARALVCVCVRVLSVIHGVHLLSSCMPLVCLLSCVPLACVMYSWASCVSLVFVLYAAVSRRLASISVCVRVRVLHAPCMYVRRFECVCVCAVGALYVCVSIHVCVCVYACVVCALCVCIVFVCSTRVASLHAPATSACSLRLCMRLPDRLCP